MKRLVAALGLAELGSPGFMLASGDGAWWITWYSSDATFSPTNGGLPPTSS